MLNHVAAQVEGLAGRLARPPNCGLYLGQGGELNPESLLERPELVARWYAPVLTGPGLMKFAPIDRTTPLSVNALRFREPAMPPHNDMVDATELDILYAPLVGFDRQGNRLGAGGGFYDRALAARQATEPPPWFVGLAFANQEVAHVERAEWDVALDGVLTPGGVIWFGDNLAPFDAP